MIPFFLGYTHILPILTYPNTMLGKVNYLLFILYVLSAFAYPNTMVLKFKYILFILPLQTPYLSLL